MDLRLCLNEANTHSFHGQQVNLQNPGDLNSNEGHGLHGVPVNAIRVVHSFTNVTAALFLEMLSSLVIGGSILVQFQCCCF